jgi:hypothetical protein
MKTFFEKMLDNGMCFVGSNLVEDKVYRRSAFSRAHPNGHRFKRCSTNQVTLLPSQAVPAMPP